ncbi:MAG: hypothetical protein ACTSRB_16690 [Candidatus Helarchaeota archaeon]
MKIVYKWTNISIISQIKNIIRLNTVGKKKEIGLPERNNIIQEI